MTYMDSLTYFAGLQACTADELNQRTLAPVVALGVFVAIIVGALFLARLIVRSHIKNGLKIILGVLLGMIALLLGVGLPFITLGLLLPWCS